MAKAINPGSPALRLAYEFAGSSYDPSKFTDVFGTGAQKQEPEAESKVGTDFVTAYPNPANPQTTISYSLSSPSRVKLSIYNISGQKVATLVDGTVSSGVHAVKFDGSKFGSGLYFYKFASDKFTKTGKMLLLK
ncbi:MAG: T9SS type A sorting domain-containing protein, partial [Candidatus Latescibacterota bacterium]